VGQSSTSAHFGARRNQAAAAAVGAAVPAPKGPRPRPGLGRVGPPSEVCRRAVVPCALGRARHRARSHSAIGNGADCRLGKQLGDTFASRARPSKSSVRLFSRARSLSRARAVDSSVTARPRLRPRPAPSALSRNHQAIKIPDLCTGVCAHEGAGGGGMAGARKKNRGTLRRPNPPRSCAAARVPSGNCTSKVICKLPRSVLSS